MKAFDEGIKLVHIIFVTACIAIVVVFCLWIGRIIIGIGPGAFRRHITMSGIYSVCKPDGYPTVCFLDADSKDGGLSCMPYNGECK